MNLDRRTLEPGGNSLFGFDGKKIDALGKKAIPVSFAEGEKVRTETITFDIVNVDYPYTAIFGRGVLNKFKIVIKQSYLCMKMPSPFGIIAMHGDQATSRQIEGKPIPGYSLINEVTKKPSAEKLDYEKAIEARAQPVEDTMKTPLSNLVPEKCVHIGSDLTKDEKDGLISFLHENQEYSPGRQKICKVLAEISPRTT
jgi:hypothetical protein